MPENNKYLALYMRQQAERIRATARELENWAKDLDATAERLDEDVFQRDKPDEPK